MTVRQRVHIKISDRGWILERMAKELSDRLPYVFYGTDADRSAAIQYYMTYGCHTGRVSPLEIAYFTHKEQVQPANQLFDDIARQVDLRIAQSLTTQAELARSGFPNSPILSPGVDLDVFDVRLRVGVVGRTYHTGRKGEALVAQVMDLPGVDWVFTGAGWPGESVHIPDADLPAFYRSLDYLVVPSLIEGGPMCVLEAIAVGCPVVAAPVGWVPQFPHIPFRLGDAADLRRVLTDLLNQKRALRAPVQNQTWDAWADQHDRLFHNLLPANTAWSLPTPITGPRCAIVLHGNETSSSLGGPSVRAPLTAAALRAQGVDCVNLDASTGTDLTPYDLIHTLNVWSPVSCAALLRSARKHAKPVVLSSIFLNLSERGLYNAAIPAVLAGPPEAISDRLNHLRQDPNPPLPGFDLPAYHESLRALFALTDHVILLSEHERAELSAIGINPPNATVVRNPVDHAAFAGGDPELFRTHIGCDDYVLCVGRIEPRKNQAMLAHALRGSGLKLVLVGHVADPAYADLIRSVGGPDVIFAGRLPSGSALLRSAYAGASVFCLPSWSEGAPLSALEAAAAGSRMVLSDRSSEREYFGDLARYVDPSNPDDILSAVLAARADQAFNPEALQEWVCRHNSFEGYAAETHAVYQKTLAAWIPAAKRAGVVYVDLTTSANHVGSATGIARVEECLANIWRSERPSDVRFMMWNSHFFKYVPLTEEQIASPEFKDMRGINGAPWIQNIDQQASFSDIDFKPEDTILVMGSAWMRNNRYTSDLLGLKAATGVAVVSIVYDVMQHRLTHLYPKEASGPFCANAARLAEVSDRMLTCSQASAADLRAFFRDAGVSAPPIDVVRLGDSNFDTGVEPPQEGVLQRLPSGKPFVLYVSSFDTRKNHRLLLDVWDRLLATHPPGRVPHLVLVGKNGWGSKAWNDNEVLDAMSRHPGLSASITVLDCVSDATLNHLYRSCLFTVYPSLYEGWGLPVAESLGHGKFCLSSNGGSLKEVAPGFVDYLDPKDFIGWCTAVMRCATNPDYLRTREQKLKLFQGTSWTSAAADVLAAARAASSLPAPTAPTVLNAPLLAGESALDSIFVGGWSPPETSGRWTLGRRAVLRVALPLGATSISFSIKALAAKGWPPQTVRVTIENGPSVVWAVPGERVVRHLDIPAVLSGQTVRIELETPDARRPSDMIQSKDGRLLGVHLDAWVSHDSQANAIALLWDITHAPSNKTVLAPKSFLDHIDALLAADGDDFVPQAYHSILGRAPDPAGAAHFQEALLSGKLSKAEILLALAGSPEASGRADSLIDLSRLLNRRSPPSTRSSLLSKIKRIFS